MGDLFYEIDKKMDETVGLINDFARTMDEAIGGVDDPVNYTLQLSLLATLMDTVITKAGKDPIEEKKMILKVAHGAEETMGGIDAGLYHPGQI